MDKSEDDDFAVDAEFPDPKETGGPPDDWRAPSFYDRVERDWWWNGRPDPCPVKPLGFCAGDYIFVTAAGERRSFRSQHLHSSGGLTDLFGGHLWWPLRHFRKWDHEKGSHVGGLRRQDCIAALIRRCGDEGVYDGAIAHRGVGTWRGPDGRPIVHTGDRIFADGQVHQPGAMIGDALYLVGALRQAPSYINVGRNGYEWAPCGADVGHTVVAHIDEWHWLDVEARDLFVGGLWCDMLGPALRWKPHKFVRAPAGSGKTSLLKYVRALLGGSAHPIERTYSKAQLEERYSHTACALLLDESESDTEAERLRKVFDLVLLLSDEGAVGGRFKRDIDLHGIFTMVATLTEEWRSTIRSRVAALELRPFRDRLDHPPAPPETIIAMTAKAAELSAGLRARAIARWDLFHENLGLIRRRILELGGDPRDADQVGHLLAGWACMTGDAPIDADELRRLDRFSGYIRSLVDAEDGTDDPMDLWNVMLGLPVQSWRGGDQMILGQLIARGRRAENTDIRRTLLGYGLRFHRVGDERYDQAWVAVANKHPGLDRLLAEYPQYRGPKRAQILSGLRRVVDGVGVVEAKPSDGPMRFAGPQSRAILIPPELLPSLEQEREATGEGSAAVE